MRRMTPLLIAAMAVGGCAGENRTPAAGSPAPALLARQHAREQQLQRRLDRRDGALSVVTGQRRRAAVELLRLQRVRGRASGQTFTLRYGSDGSGDPAGWKQAGAQATKAPNSTAATIARFAAARAAGRIELVGAATAQEITGGLIDDRVLLTLIALSGAHRLQVNSLRVSHPATVQDELGTPTSSNHIYGRAADISAVDGVACK
jgi:hypothetical protein